MEEEKFSDLFALKSNGRTDNRYDALAEWLRR